MTEEEIKDNELILKIQKDTLENLKKYNENRKTQIGDEPLVPKLTLIHHEETFVEEDPSEYTEIEVVPFFEEDEPVKNILDAFERGEKGVTVPPMQEWLDTQDKLNKERNITVGEKAEEEKFGQLPEPITEITGDSVNPVMEKQYDEPIIDNHPLGLPLLCQWCGNIAYQGQIHGYGYCKEKFQYEQ